MSPLNAVDRKLSYDTLVIKFMTSGVMVIFFNHLSNQFFVQQEEILNLFILVLN